ncbi:hypothetical protein [Streptomyces morookaense]|uniref:Uncharacterized protein n=1 Tax=Streptomyces morookaense TaxID=1970 RepID=A0A7Y7E5S2_STRMO|nr:hypothetical protein [Streptomyces morookaense]NVK77223.1 hypothetical protein [Streptomyces morookaense]GHF17672.1 hypothetical protein GCM10010359_19050 [Streptomyces morookaense]
MPLKSPAAYTDALLATLDALPYPQRMRHTAVEARGLNAAEGPAALRAVLDELDRRGGHYERALAAHAAWACREADWLAARPADPDPVVRGYAATAVRHGLVPDAAVTAALDDAPAAVRRTLLRAVVAGRRTALADALVRPLRERWGDGEAVRLLPACSTETVAELLPGLFHAVVGWNRLAVRHAAVILDVAEGELTALPEARRHGWWHAHAAAVAAASEAEPHRVLGLLENLCTGSLPWPVRRRLGRLAAADPARTARLLLAPDRHPEDRRTLPRPVLRAFVQHAPAELPELARALSEDDAALVRLLREVPPTRRAAAYDAAMAGRDMSRAVLSDALLDVLPHTRREAEARRMAAQARERGASWHRVLEAVAHLPAAEAREELLAATRRSAADDRAHGYRMLFRNAGRSGDPAVVTGLLAGLTRLRNEQDPVRSPALEALARIHPALFTDAAAPHLERITTDACEARDLSWQGRCALNDLAVALLREHAVTGGRELTDWAMRTLGRLAGADRVRFGGLRRGQEHQVYEALRSWLETDADMADYTLTFTLARSLGRRARNLPGLQALLRRAIDDGGEDTVRTAVALWLEDPAARDERLTEVLAVDPSVATLHPVSGILARRRTDLLDAVLTGTPPYGRFLRAGSHWLPPVHGAACWLPRQRAAAARMVGRAADDASLHMHQRVTALHLAARVPEHGTEILLRHAESPEVGLAEAALAGLARTGRPGDQLPALLAHAGSDRARVAVYAATRASRYVAPSQLAGMLRGLLLAEKGVKVTSRKEAARLAATVLPVREAVSLLAEACAQPGLHHDVQAACVAFTTGLLSCEEAWDLLESAATGRRELRLAVLRTWPFGLPEHHRARYAELVCALCDTDDPEVAEAGYRALGEWARWAPKAAGVLAAAVTDLDNRSSWQAAAHALCRIVTEGAPVTPLTGALAELIAADAAPDVADAEPGRDRPARRRVRHLAGDVAARGRFRPMRAAVVEVAEFLAGHGDFVPQAAEVLVQAADLHAAPEALAAELLRLARLHEGRPALAVRTAGALDGRLRERNVGGTDLAAAADTLAADGGCAAGLFAVTLTAAGGRRTGWAAPWRERLRGLRRHGHADVRDAALELCAP